ncbi:aldehyde dehydrogenase family protein, partial [Rhodococcus sp. (in: high G+C Gram-positive bacteria)]|uniref:aldehyde dehydrogenase family protein n=2 Tax=unclassified Rhodococcus (in: high G+C Gram-positive bacteria) TaxID=192944 RepID=UPI00257C2C4E
MTDYDKLYIGGAWVAPATDQVLEVFSPATEERVGSCPIAAPADIDAAVSAARAAFEGPWSRTTPAERGAILAKAAKLIEERSAEINQLISNEMGQPPAMVGMMQQTPSMATLGYYAELADKFGWEEKRTGAFGQTKVTREPVGVVAAVLAWNVPLFLAINKLAPALLAGCTVLLKPAPESPLSVHVIAEIFTEAGVPEGVISVLPGGAETGEYLVSHAGIDKITFTGSSAVGRKIGAIAAQNLKRCSLELGGKSA